MQGRQILAAAAAAAALLACMPATVERMPIALTFTQGLPAAAAHWWVRSRLL